MEKENKSFDDESNVFEEIEEKKDSPKENNDGKENAKKRMNKRKKKKIIRTVIIVVLVIAALLFAAYKTGLLKQLFGKDNAASQQLTTYAVTTRTITKVLESSGMLEPYDERDVSSLVNGEIVFDYIQEGDSVLEDEKLYDIESDKLDSGVTRAGNALKKAQTNLADALENSAKLEVKSNYSGVVQKLHVEVGDEVQAGQLIADIVDKETMCIDIPFLSTDCEKFEVGDKAILEFSQYSYDTLEGTVTEISAATNTGSSIPTKNVTISVKNPGSITNTTVAFAQIGDSACTAQGTFYYNDSGSIHAKISGDVTAINFAEGDYINKNQIIAKLESTNLMNQIDILRSSIEDAETALDDAYDSYDDYRIKAPISGKVVIKNYKAGDTISGGSMSGSSNALARIYDMSALKFDMNIDEIDIDALSVGQDVIITCDSREGKQYNGKVTYIDYYNYTNTNGTTTYPVEVTIENVEDESLRTVDADGTVHKTYKTGMTATEKIYNLARSENKDNGVLLHYGDFSVLCKTDDDKTEYIIGNNKLRPYVNGTYTYGTSFYKFSDDFSSVTVEVQDEKSMLKCGMNVDAQIVVEKKENVIAVPLAAVARGNTVKVVKNPEKLIAENKSDENKDENKQNNRSTIYGTAPLDTECEEARVSVGISDESFVEILSGLKEGDVIIVEGADYTSDLYKIMGAMMPAGGGMSGPPNMGGGMSGGPNMGGGMNRQAGASSGNGGNRMQR